MSQRTDVTYEHLAIEPFELVTLNELIITKKINEHGTLYFTGEIPESVKDEYVLKADFGTPVAVVQNKDSETKILFNGIIKDIGVKMEGSRYYLSVNAVTGTYLMDIQIKSRSFQDNNMMYSNLVEKITKEHDGGAVIFMPEDKTLSQFTIQYRETDWEFVKRMASRFNEGLYPDFRFDSPKYFFGKPDFSNKEKVKLEEIAFMIRKNMSDFRHITTNFIPRNTHKDYISYEVETFHQLELGEGVLYRDNELFVRRVSMQMVRGILQNIYYLSPINGLKQPEIKNMSLQGVAISGNVIDIRRDQIKVHMHEIDESQDIATAHWFCFQAMYASKDGSGFYCMPEFGDIVRIGFPNNEEAGAFAVSSVSSYNPQTDDPEEDRMGNHEVRYIRNPQGMEVTLTPEEVIISANGAGVIIMDEKGKINIYATQKLAFSSGKEILLSAGESINITASDNINITCGELAEIKLNDGGITKFLGSEVFTN